MIQSTSDCTQGTSGSSSVCTGPVLATENAAGKFVLCDFAIDGGWVNLRETDSQ